MDVRFERLMASDIAERIKEEIDLRGMITDSMMQPSPKPPPGPDRR